MTDGALILESPYGYLTTASGRVLNGTRCWATVGADKGFVLAVVEGRENEGPHPVPSHWLKGPVHD
jgi:hypothetical protein